MECEERFFQLAASKHSSQQKEIMNWKKFFFAFMRSLGFLSLHWLRLGTAT